MLSGANGRPFRSPVVCRSIQPNRAARRPRPTLWKSAIAGSFRERGNTAPPTAQGPTNRNRLGRPPVPGTIDPHAINRWPTEASPGRRARTASHIVLVACFASLSVIRARAMPGFSRVFRSGYVGLPEQNPRRLRRTMRRIETDPEEIRVSRQRRRTGPPRGRHGRTRSRSVRRREGADRRKEN
jgi:hypothetical protein